METALVNARVLLPQGLREGLSVTIADGQIRSVSSEPPAGAAIVDGGGAMLLPGFIDTQVNGGGGVLFNDAPTVETIATIAQAHRRFGTTGLLPTLISDDLAVVAAAIRAVDEAIEAGVPGILGIHIEGPFLSVARRGIHDAGRLRRIDQDAIALLGSARHGRTLVTLAPECVEPGDVSALVAAGVIVAAGHSEADYDTVRHAIGEGLSGFTHLFNAMSPLANRAPGMTGAALEDDRTTAGLIVDGHHVHPAVIRIALKAKGHERLMLVTDAMALTGVDDDHFLLQGRKIMRDGDRLVDAKGTLAGSTLTMTAAVSNMIAQTGIDLRRAVAMASATPAVFLGIADRTGAIAPGLSADLILVDDDWQVKRSWIAGREAA
ncbi:N-acetylglucosamine-6-phosphate deacetylase [Sphingomonas abietis]|uniref:N-acetylglucosamine-6-phosphate deacetylase n=1 Tax=Sphingomonas abietis TaxID=3012344 RepID=A0ABY7NQU3_9SPHN|nr:N-acetylglucosamine-6-phosphate deacetylase [Sphingomonas abietis]WBO21861.1 N-acetylglucosamine-6-phosphate deacetylase [Sphingomonas abietis]